MLTRFGFCFYRESQVVKHVSELLNNFTNYKKYGNA